MIAAILQVKRDRSISDGAFDPGLAGTVTWRAVDRLQTGMLAGCVFPFVLIVLLIVLRKSSDSGLYQNT